MNDEKYTDTQEYQKEIAEQYKRRVVTFDKEKIVSALKSLGFDNVGASDLTTAKAGNMNATYLTKDLVVKINKQNDGPHYLSNKIVSDRLSQKTLVVKVLAYDCFDKTPFELLAMRREPGIPLLDDIFQFSEDELKNMFRQVLKVVKEMFAVEFDSFGWLNFEGKESYPSFAEFLIHEFSINAQTIKNERLCKPQEVDNVERYFLEHIDVFNTAEKATVMHRDLHMGNFLHQGTTLTAIIDFDSSMKGPKLGSLVSLLCFIDNPSQFTEGSEYFEQYKGKNFNVLLPTLKEEFKDILAQKDLHRKLNLLFISEGIRSIAENWSQGLNEYLMQGILTSEIPADDADLKNTYFAKILSDEARG